MKNVLKAFGIIAIVAVIGFSFTACGGDSGGGGDPDLSGTITISPSTGVTTGTKLTATYSGSETVSYQWKNGSANVGTNSKEFTPTAAGSYTVTVSAAGYKSKTSTAVTVTGSTLTDLSGTITITPNSGTITTGTELTATYSGSGEVSYQWKNGSNNVGTASTTKPNKYTPTEAGSYTVTVSAAGYNSKTSNAVTVTYAPFWTAVDLGSIFNYNPSTGQPTTGTITGISYGNNMFVAVGYRETGGTTGGKMATSTDGVTWTAVTDNGFSGSYYGNININAIVYGNGKFVAVGSRYSSTSNSNGKIATSTDGVTWTAANINISETILSSYLTYGIDQIAYGDSKFVAVGSCNTRGKMWTSTDGTTWTENTTFGTNIIGVLSYANNKFFAVSGGNMWTSTDGETWTVVTGATLSGIREIIYANNKFVAFGNSGKIATSLDGTTWTDVTDSTFGSSDINAITYGNGKFVAVGKNGKMATSTDGTTWTTVTNTTFIFDINTITYGNNKFVAGGYAGKIAYSTTDY